MERITGMTSPDDWATETVARETPQEDDRAALVAEAQEMFSQAVYAVTAAISDLNRGSVLTTDDALERLAYDEVAESIAWIQDTRRDLAVLESYLSRRLGSEPGCPDALVLPSGRHAEVMKGKDRKAWDHEAWQRDVRVAVVGETVFRAYADAETGELVDLTPTLLDVAARIQAVHGSTAPKIRALKALSLDADDYSETYPGPFSVKVSPPPTENIATTTTGA